MKRRDFLKAAAAAAVSVQALPRHVLGGQGQTPPSGKLNLASIGVGGMGGADIGRIAQGPINMVAICNVDERNLAAAAARFPQAKPYTDWRKLLDEQAKHIDAVSVSTPDHMHAAIVCRAILRGKHVYCQKPMTHDIYEARQRSRRPRKPKRGHPDGHPDPFQHRVPHGRRDHPGRGDRQGEGSPHLVVGPGAWPQGGPRRTVGPVPAGLHWDLWLGVPPPAALSSPGTMHPCWRGVLDFGAGALGDMGCHIIDTPCTALKLGAPEPRLD